MEFALGEYIEIYTGDGGNPSVTALSGRATSLGKGGKGLQQLLAPLLRGLSAELTGGFPRRAECSARPACKSDNKKEGFTMPSPATIIVGLILLAAVALAVRSLWKGHKKGGCSACGGSCDCCGGGCHGRPADS